MFGLHNRRIERRIYWAGWLVGAAGIALGMQSRDGRRGIFITFVVLMLFAVVIAVRYTPYFKLGGRIIAISRFDRRPDPTGNDDTAAPIARTPRRITAQEVRTASFSKPLGRQGYDPEQVDALLERIAERLDGRGHLTAEDIRTAQFSRPRAFMRGYDPEEVDKLLDDAIAALPASDTE